MSPFSPNKACLSIVDTYPEPDLLRSAIVKMTRRDREYFVRLWLTEGIPFAFKGVPFLYEEIRNWIGRELEVHPKCITIVGSGRIGYSIAARKYGQRFGNNSDLDILMISERHFYDLKSTFEKWRSDYLNNFEQPNTSKEKYCWDDNLVNLPRNISRGFIDSWKLPGRYDVPITINNSMWKLEKNIKMTQMAPNIGKTSMRVYKDFKAMVDQISLSILYSANSLKNCS